jgi:hypothetical protein
MNDQNKKTLRQFQCRDYLWEIFEQMSGELECSVDYLINEAMRQYARSRNYGGARSGAPGPEPTGQRSLRDQGSGPPSMTGGPPRRVPSQPSIPSAPPPPPARASGPQGGYPAPPGASGGYPAPPGASGGYPAPPSRSSGGGYPAPPAPGYGGGGYGAPAPQQGGYGAPPPQPAGGFAPQQGGGFPPPQQAGYGGPPQPGSGYGAPQGGGYPAPPPPRSASSFPPPPPQPGRGGAGAPPPLPGGGPGAPRAASSGEAMPTLFVIFNGQKFPVNKEEFIIGRGTKTADLAIKDGNISRRHAAIIFQNGGFYMKDLGSTNGVEFQGRKVDGRRIEEGDVYQLCDYELRFTYR